MTLIVVDASVALAWCFPDENTEYADSVLEHLSGGTALVPALWAVEVTNALLVGGRQRRIKPADVRRYLTLLDGLDIVQDLLSVGGTTTQVLPLAKQYDLTAYDATYLELAIREDAGLATLDAKMMRAAKLAGARIWPSGSHDSR